MKLVELLARELKVWPEHGCVQITQDKDKNVYYWRRDGAVFDGDEWSHESGGLCDTKWFLDPMPASICTDHATAIVTRADWEAEVSRMAKPEWIRHRGGKCPVEAGFLIDVRHRDGCIGTRCNPFSGKWDWRHSGHETDIMAYRIREPDPQTYTLEWEEREPEQPPRERIKDLHAHAIAVGMGVSVENPLIWRDRIREIDTTVEALEEERAGLVQKLEDEGFRLIGVAGKQPSQLEWQRLAMSCGSIVPAVKAHREANGSSLKDAADAVKQYVANA